MEKDKLKYYNFKTTLLVNNAILKNMFNGIN